MESDQETRRQLADLLQRVTRAEERLEQGDPRVAEALETAQRALSSAASATEQQAAIDKLRAELGRIQQQLPRARRVPAEDPDPPADPNARNEPTQDNPGMMRGPP